MQDKGESWDSLRYNYSSIIFTNPRYLGQMLSWATLYLKILYDCCNSVVTNEHERVIVMLQSVHCLRENHLVK